MHRPRARHFQKKRQTTVGDFSGAVTASADTSTDTSAFVFASSVSESQSASAPELGTTGTPTITTATHTSIKTLPPTADGATSPTTNADLSTASGKSIPTSTVVGACVATVVVLLIALFALYWTRSRDKALRRVPASAAFRNMNGNVARRRSGREAWARLSDDAQRKGAGGGGGDEWTGMSPMRQTQTPGYTPAQSPNTSAPFVTEKDKHRPPQLQAQLPISPLDVFKFPSPTHSPIRQQPSYEELGQPYRQFARDDRSARNSSFLSLKSASGVLSSAMGGGPSSPISPHEAISEADPQAVLEATPSPRGMSSWNPDAFPDEPVALDDSSSAIHNPFADDATSAGIHHRYNKSSSSDSHDTHTTRQSAGTIALATSHAEREREMRAMKNLIAALDHPAPPSSFSFSGSSVSGSAVSASGKGGLSAGPKSRVSAMSAVSGMSEYSQFDDSTVSSFPPPPPSPGFSGHGGHR